MEYNRDDRRTRAAQQQIRDSLFRLMREKPLNKITVKEICEGAAVNRSTFYSYYADIYDLHIKIIKEYFTVQHAYTRALLARLGQEAAPAAMSRETYRELAFLFLDTVEKNKALYQFIYHESSPAGLSITANRLLFTKLMKLLPEERRPRFRRAFTFVSGGTAATVIAWLAEDCAAPARSLAESLGDYYYSVLSKETE